MGKTTLRVVRRSPFIETPPRAWGRLPFPVVDQAFARNTPTCMGKTTPEDQPSHPCWKHPHVHGEDHFFLRLRRWQQETPPRAWGRQVCTPEVCTREGNTPTCMGKTWWSVWGFLGEEKHPHVHGEDGIERFWSRSTRETPPRAWGRRHLAQNFTSLPGNTPTCMGKTSRRRSKFGMGRKHPHVHGEDGLRVIN